MSPDKMQAKMAKQTNEIARLHDALSNCAGEANKLRDLLRAAVEDRPGWRDEARRKLGIKVTR